MSRYGPPLCVIHPLNSINIITKIDNIQNTGITNDINIDDLPLFTMQDVNQLNHYAQHEIYYLYSQQGLIDNNIITKDHVNRLDFLLDKHEQTIELLTNATYYYNHFDQINKDTFVNGINKRIDLYYRYILPYISTHSDILDEITDIFGPIIMHKCKTKQSRNYKRKTKHKRKSYKK